MKKLAPIFRAKAFIAGLSAVVFLWLGAVHFAGYAGPKPKRDFDAVVEVRYYRTSPQDIVTLRIPEGYINRWVEGPRIEGVQERLHLEALGQDLTPQTESNQQSFTFPASLRNVINFSISSLYRLQPRQVDERTQHVLEFHSAIMSNTCKWSAQSRVTYGLHHQIIDPASCPNERPYTMSRRDLYQLKKENGELVTVIRCSPVDLQEPDPRLIDGVTPTPGPRCEHRFAMKTLNSRVELHYHRDFLPHWREVEQAVIKRLESFVVRN